MPCWMRRTCGYRTPGTRLPHLALTWACVRLEMVVVGLARDGSGTRVFTNEVTPFKSRTTSLWFAQWQDVSRSCTLVTLLVEVPVSVSIKHFRRYPCPPAAPHHSPLGPAGCGDARTAPACH
ncbi:hypothetical protein E2C01_066738 [Portunus trituberculatus]|uniref:Secreted protein n=1 Tax=Portunus trituberculatus TaxID=210409 RepID=A0A5B7HQL7_PORTR|nr:hypothetical protein [Portunus trituberculatus]